MVLGKKIGIDLGTSASRLHLRGEGAVTTEPSAVACEVGSGRVLGVGSAAEQLAARPDVVIRRPLRDGLVADPLAADAMLTGLVHRSSGRQRIFRPDLM
ncbi:MAG TPA: rod shape-determining protein, partial [Candidatus Dormibacteraeota bacterium]|nr:rod shape-determining protein [Candidatus Dormibacteraeota bacterium]